MVGVRSCATVPTSADSPERESSDCYWEERHGHPFQPHDLVGSLQQGLGNFPGQMLNLPAPRRWGPFQMVVTENGANLDYMDTDGEITPQHYALLISEAEFDESFGRIRDRKLPYWADPGRRQLGEVDHNGREVRRWCALPD